LSVPTRRSSDLILPSAADVTDLGLAAELAFGADLARDPGDFGGETAQLIDHGVDRVFELENLAAHVDSNLLRQIAVGDGDSDVSDVAHLGGQVAGHHVDAFRQIFPNTANASNFEIASASCSGADVARDAADSGSRGVELVDHGVDGFF